MFAFCIPEMLTWLRSARIFFTMNTSWPPLHKFSAVFTMETIHTFGLVLLFYSVLPELDSVRAMMLSNAIYLLPGLLCLLRPKRNMSVLRTVCLICIDVLAVCFQIMGLILWPIMNSSWTENIMEEGYFWYFSQNWTFPLSLLLTSFGWWESFVDENSSNFLSKFLWKVKMNMIEEGTR